jgi:hypothetical protein
VNQKQGDQMSFWENCTTRDRCFDF